MLNHHDLQRLTVLYTCGISILLRRAVMAPRASAWNPRDESDHELLTAFRWEIAQALKLAFTHFDEYDKQNKITFLRNYAVRFPIERLEACTITEFGPPLQRKIRLLMTVLDPLPPELWDNITCFLEGWPKSGGRPLTLQAAETLCAKHFFGPLELKGGKLSMALPKSGDWGNHRKPKGVSKEVTSLMEQPWVKRHEWWDLPGGIFQAVSQVPDCLAARIIRAETAARSAVQVAKTLSLPGPPTDPKRERHSIELMIKEVTNSSHRYCRSTRALATMVVPDDVSVVALEHYMSRVTEDDLRGWCYLTVADMDQFQEEETLRHERRALLKTREQHHVKHSPYRLQPGQTMEDTEEDRVALAPRRPYKVHVRVSRIQMDDVGNGTDYSGADLRGRVAGGRKPLIDQLCARIGTPACYTDEEDGGWEFAGEHAENMHKFGVREPGVEPRSTRLEICHDVALSDVLPSPEERSPPLAGFLSPSDMKLNRRISGFQIDLQWSKSYKVYELYGLRRLPRLPDADYPVVRFTNATPRNPI